MPIKKSADKALRQTRKREEHNQKIKQNINWLERQFLKAVSSKNKKGAADFYLKCQKAIDKASQKRVIKKNTASRKKSRLARKLSELK